MNLYDYVGSDAINLVQVSFTSDVDMSDAFSRSTSDVLLSCELPCVFPTDVTVACGSSA